MRFNFQQLEELSNSIGTPAYIVNEDLFTENIENISTAFKSRYKNTIVGYSFKTNYVPYICKCALDKGCYAEVVSFLEYQIALAIGCNPQKIIFNGPIKRKEEFQQALLAGSLINIDSDYEVEYLKQIRETYPNLPIKIGVRVNVAIKDNSGHTAIYGEEEIGRFGFIDEELDDLFSSLRLLNCNIVSLHGHTSSKNRAIYNYIQISNKLLSIQEKYNLDLDYLDIGGGFFGPVPKGMFAQEPPTFDEYAEAIIINLNKNRWFLEKQPILIIEPGMSVAASSMSYVTQIYNIKKRANRIVAQVDGDMFHIRPNLYQFKLPYSVISHKSVVSDNNDYTIDFTGSTCMESDVMVRKKGKLDFKVGDFLKIDNVGAYTFVMSSNFIQFMPNIAVYKDGKFKLLREGSNFENFINIYHW